MPCFANAVQDGEGWIVYLVPCYCLDPAVVCFKVSIIYVCVFGVVLMFHVQLQCVAEQEDNCAFEKRRAAQLRAALDEMMAICCCEVEARLARQEEAFAMCLFEAARLEAEAEAAVEVAEVKVVEPPPWYEYTVGENAPFRDFIVHIDDVDMLIPGSFPLLYWSALHGGVTLVPEE